LTSRMLARRIADAMLTKKAHDIVILDLRKLTSATDYFVICSADSDTQVKAVADEIRDRAERIGSNPWHSEGYHALSWVLVDFVDVVAHVFHHESRSFYNLDRLWVDAKMTHVRDEDTTEPSGRPVPSRVEKSTVKKRLKPRKESQLR
jgi:ribosome-associated protein